MSETSEVHTVFFFLRDKLIFLTVYYFFKDLFIFERDRDRDTDRESGKGQRERGTQNPKQAVSTEPDAGLEPTNCEIMT